MTTGLPGLFVVGTDTGVGKTRVASALARALVRDGRRVGVLKPVATGAALEGGGRRCDDAERLIEAVGGGVPVERVAPIVFDEPLAPSVAARRAGAPLEQAEVERAAREALGWWAGRAEVMVVEGVGGLLCPLAEGTTVADLAVAIDYPLLIVARRGLGTLNHTLLTVEAARLRGLRIAGVVLNSPEPSAGRAAEATNAQELARRLPPGVAVLAELSHVSDLALPDPEFALDWYHQARRTRDGGGGWIMPSDVIEPPIGSPEAEGSGEARPAPAPADVPLSSSSGDELSVSLAHGRPDPLLGEFGPEPPPVSSSEALTSLVLNNPAPPAPSRDEDDEEAEPARGASWVTLLLASYASAVTLGLVWVLWTGRRPREAAEADFLPPADTRPDPGRRADRARRVSPPPPIAADHLTALGEPVRLGVIEATPLSVSSGPVALERSFAGRERKAGGRGALKLRLRLKNTSAETVVAPLDEAFVRDREAAGPDSVIETSRGGPPIGMYPLAVESEWSIVGQEFRDLRPGEVWEALVVSAPDAVGRTAPEMTWRVRLRTDLNHTDDLGVRFRASDVKPEPPRADEAPPRPNDGRDLPDRPGPAR